MKTTQIFIISLLLLSACKKSSDSPTKITVPEIEKKQPTANFIASKYFPKSGDTVKFVNNSENAETYEWDFGDGEKSSEASPTHVYKTKGKYKIKLITKNGNKTSSFDTCIFYGLKASVHFKFYVSKWLYSGSSEASLFNFYVRFYKGSTASPTKILDCSSGIVQIYGANGLISVDVPLDDESQVYSAILSIENDAYCGLSYPPEIVETFEPVNLSSFPFLNKQQIDQSLRFRRFLVNYQISELRIE